MVSASAADGDSAGSARCDIGFFHEMGQRAFHASHCSLVRGACAGTASRSSGGSAWRVTSARAASGTSRSSSKEEEEEEEDAMHTTRRRRSSPSSALRTRLTCARASGRGISAHASLSCDGRDEGEMAEERASSGRRERAGGTTDGVEREEEDDGGARTNGWTDGRRARTKSEHARLSTRVVHTSASSNTGGGVAGTCVGSPSATSAMPAAAARRDTDEEDASGRR